MLILRKVINMRTVSLLSLGCKVNTYETEYIRNLLEENNYQIKDFNDKCDIYIINTCTVTNSSDSKSRKMIRKAINKNPHACIVAMGCFIESSKNNLIDGIDIVIGNQDKNKILELLDEYFNNKSQIVRLYNTRDKVFDDMFIKSFPGRTRAFVKIQDGCDNFCSYCIIPFVRGKCRSKDPNKVIEEVKTLVNNGYKEVVLTGIHTGNYGNDLNYKFYDLLNDLIKIDGLIRLRISSIEVTELNDKILELIKKSNVIVDHLHIPLQSGSDEILKLMNRKYDLEYFKNKIKEIRDIRKNISITTDVIVGFPNETDELFLETIDTVKEINFSKIHVFPYSDRNGTVSSRMENKVGNSIVKDRARQLIKVSEQLEKDYYNKFVGCEVEVLIETVSNDESFGHSGNYLPVLIKKKLVQNEIYKVKIVEVKYPNLIGEL